MVFTVTLNPTLDITYSIEEISFGEPMRHGVEAGLYMIKPN